MKMPWQYIVFVSVIVLLFALIIYADAPGKNHDFVVVITDTKFIPDIVYIKPGDTITWVNAGAQRHWPASDDHRTHGNYPQTSERDCLGSLFDACRGLYSGERWSFIYAYEGMWNYHDHIFPEITGTVIVNKEDNPFRSFNRYQGESVATELYAQKILSLIQNDLFLMNKAEFMLLSNDEQETYIKTLAKQSPEKALWYLNAFGSQNEPFLKNGHILTHAIGNEFYNTYEMRGLEKCNNTFGDGCYHGVVERFMLYNGIYDPTAVERACRKVFLSNHAAFPDCIQGMTYPLLLKMNFNIQTALAECEKLSPINKEHCADGIFREYQAFISPEQLNKNTVWEICARLPQKYQTLCAQYQPNIFREVLGLEFSELNALCVLAHGPNLKNVCAQSVGNLLAYVVSSDDKILALCDFGDMYLELASQCVMAAQQKISTLRN